MKRLALISTILITLCGNRWAKPEFAALVSGKTVTGQWVPGVCTNKPNRDAAIKCAEKAFKKKGGLVALHVRDWQCKGWIAAASSSQGNVWSVWCRRTKTEAQANVLDNCTRGGQTNCAIFFLDDDSK